MGQGLLLRIQRCAGLCILNRFSEEDPQDFIKVVASLLGFSLRAKLLLGSASPSAPCLGLSHRLIPKKEKEKKTVRSCSSSSELWHLWEGVMVTRLVRSCSSDGQSPKYKEQRGLPACLYK